jgi:hypothetical protein
MGYPSCLENDVERRGQNRAAIEFEYQQPQPNARRVASAEPFAQRRRAGDMPSQQSIVWLKIYDDKQIVMFRAVRTGRAGA